jgi:choloylglycine hydrolase
MCTSLTLPTPNGTHLFGRTLDLDTHFGEQVTFTPRGYRFSLGGGAPTPSRYALLGMANLTDGYPLYAEAMNEAGLCMAGLRFAKSAAYAEPHSDTPSEGTLDLAPWELIPSLLGNCATVAEARSALQSITVVNKPYSPALPAAPLHWHIADRDPSHGGLVVEVTAAGMSLYDDRPVGTSVGTTAGATDGGAGVLANEPPYPSQLAALLACKNPQGDAPGLPGDYSSPSRFIRAATLRRWAVDWIQRGGNSETEPNGVADSHASVAQFFRILGAVSPTPGAVITAEGRCHRTLYTCCMDTAEGVYHWLTEGETAVRSVAFRELDLDGSTVSRLCGR